MVQRLQENPNLINIVHRFDYRYRRELTYLSHLALIELRIEQRAATRENRRWSEMQQSIGVLLTDNLPPAAALRCQLSRTRAPDAHAHWRLVPERVVSSAGRSGLGVPSAAPGPVILAHRTWLWRSLPAASATW